MNWTMEWDLAAPAASHWFPRRTAPSLRTPCLKSPSRSGCRQSALPRSVLPLQFFDVASSPPFLLPYPSGLLLFRPFPSAPFGSITFHLAWRFSSPGLRHLHYCPYGRVASHTFLPASIRRISPPLCCLFLRRTPVLTQKHYQQSPAPRTMVRASHLLPCHPERSERSAFPPSAPTFIFPLTSSPKSRLIIRSRFGGLTWRFRATCST